jgi:hypothetical protein
VIEVMNVNQINLDRAGHGNAASGRLAGWVDLHQVEPAKAAPTGCLATGLRAKITLCRIDTGRLAS